MNSILSKIEELREEALRLEYTPKIGIAISTHNRYDIFKKTYGEIHRFAPAGSVIVVVDDASEKPCPEATFRFEKNAGIAVAKNKCFELLYNAGCEHFFLFDDDCYPLTDDWYKPYIESKEPHLNYIFQEFKSPNAPKLGDTVLIYEDSKIKAYSHTRGCMCYFKRVCLNKVGGMSPIFGRWGHEHPDLSNRIYNSGLTSFRFMDIHGSDKLIYSRDEYMINANSTLTNIERSEQIKRNTSIYEERKDISEYVEFRQKENIILAGFYTGLKDAQRTERFKADKSVLRPLMDSMKGQKLVILTDSFNDETDGSVEFVKVETYIENVYFQRWVNEYQYLIENRDRLNKVFIVDSTDVQLLNSPFPQMEQGKLYVGDEAERTGCEWMVKHNPNPIISEFIKQNENKVLLNCGLVGGDVDTVISLINKFLSFYFSSVGKGVSCGSFEMGLFNYIARTHFQDKLIHGTQVNTVFKSEKANNVSWFQHK